MNILKESRKDKKENKIEHITTPPFGRPMVDEWMHETDLRIVNIILKLNQIINYLNEK